jgi:Sulfotransferase domain
MMSRISKHLAHVTQVLLGKVNAGRGLTVFPDDRFLVSYPRSGSTWTRFLIGNLVHTGEPVTFANIETVLPSIYICTDRELRRQSRPRLLTSHECFDPTYRTIIYVVRDPRDVAISYYHYCIKNFDIPDGYSLEEFVSRYIAANVNPTYDRWGSWADNVMSWVNMRQNHSSFLLLRYEDMVENPERELAKVATLLNIDASTERLHRAAQLSSADNMRSLEKQQHNQWKQINKTRSDKPFVRTASSGGWTSSLPQSCVNQIEAAWAPVMRTLGYPLSKDVSVTVV